MSESFTWKTKALLIEFVVAENGTVNIDTIEPLDSDSHVRVEEKALLPIHQLRLLGEGNYDRSKTSKALVSSYCATRLKYDYRREWVEGSTSYLEVVSKDEEAGLSVLAKFTVFDNVPVLRASMKISNESEKPVSVTSIPSLVVGALTRNSEEWWYDYTVSTATNSWFREAQWRQHSLPDTGVDTCLHPRLPASFHTFGCSNQGTFSTGTHLPMGMLSNKANPETWLWQVESNGSWKWEIGDWFAHVYVAMGGPTNNDHHWVEEIQPRGSFETVPAALCHVNDKPDVAFQAMTEYRRRIRRSHKDNMDVPIIFNDYMNCLMGDPDEEKVRALIQPAVKAGAEYFVIDAGWYSDDLDWWEDIGEWQVSNKRFPNGLDKMLQEIKAAGMTPGLWLEPECIGIKSPMAHQFPKDAFFQQNGHRVMERNRFQLDFRHEAVIKHLNQTVARLVDLGAEYFKFDYNIEVIQGTDIHGKSSGAGQLEHNRAYLAWITSLFDRYPDLVIENCSSGAQRMDYAMLAIHPLQSTSDQEDPVRYGAVSAAIATAVTPEQGASWAYPQKEWSDEINAFTVVNSLLGRVHLSGRLDLLSESQFTLVAEGMRVYKSVRHEVKTGRPFWPLGLPKWHDEWLATGLVCEKRSLLSVWRRGGDENCELPVVHMAKQSRVKVTLLYPTTFSAEARWDADKGVVLVKLPNAPCARLFQLEIV